MTTLITRILMVATVIIATLTMTSSQYLFVHASNPQHPAHPVSTPSSYVYTPSLRQEAAKLGLSIGTAVNEAVLANSPAYAQILGQQFSAITPENEMKWSSVEAQRGVFTFGPADAEVQFAKQHHQLVRGHNLVWFSQLPGWLTSGSFTNEQLAALLKQHILTEAGHFAGQIWQWDVVNEPLNSDGTLRSTLWEQALGPDYIADALRWTHLADPQARLFLNDYDIEGDGVKSDAMYALVKSLKAQQVPLDGVGFETHLNLQAPFPSDVQANLQRFVDLGLDVDITEMDVRMNLPATSPELAAQADWYSQMMRACLAVRRCVDFSVWEYTDKYSWIPSFFPGQGAADIYDVNLMPKPAYTALMNTLEYPILVSSEKPQ